jgi:hypothetical protein
VGSMRKLRLLGEIRWCRLVISRGSAEDIGDRLGIRTVVLPLCQNNISDLLSYGDAVSLPAVGELPQRQLKLGVERCLEVRIQVYQDFVRGCRRRLLGSKMRCAKPNRVGLMAPVNGVYGVIYRGMHNGKAAGGVDGCRLLASGADDDQKCSVPLHHLANRFRSLRRCGREVRRGQQGDSRAGDQ